MRCTTSSEAKAHKMSVCVHVLGRRGGLMVSALVSGSSGLGSSPVLCSWARHFTLTVSLSPPGTGELNAGGNPAMG